MLTKTTLAMLAMATSLSLSLTACGGREDVVTVTTAAPSDTSTTGTNPGEQPTKAQEPTNFADEAAQAALKEVCDQLAPAEAADLLGLPEVKVDAGVTEAQDGLSKDKAYCLFDAPEANIGAVEGEDGQTFLSVSINRAGIEAHTGGLDGVVEFGDGSTGYYNDTTLLVTPTGSAYEFAFNVVLPYEQKTVSGLDYDTAELFRTKATEAARRALN